MANQMATKRGVKLRTKDLCAYCGERLGTSLVLWASVAQGTIQTAWDGTRWVPYHRVCWEQLRYERDAP